MSKQDPDPKAVVGILNQNLEAELAGVVRYTHYSFMVFGYNRIPIISWIESQANESLLHARQAGEMITHLGGHPSLAIGPLPQLKAGFFHLLLFRQRYVCLFRKGHPLDRKRFTLADFKAAEHLVIVSAGTGHGKVDELVRRAGIERKVPST